MAAQPPNLVLIDKAFGDMLKAKITADRPTALKLMNAWKAKNCPTSSSTAPKDQAAGLSSEAPSSSNHIPSASRNNSPPQDAPAPEEQEAQRAVVSPPLAPAENAQPEQNDPQPAPETPTLNDRIMATAGGNGFDTIVEMVLEAADLHNQGLKRFQTPLLPHQIQKTLTALLQRGTPGECLCWPSLPEAGCPQHTNRRPRRNTTEFTENTTGLLLKVHSLDPKPSTETKHVIRLLVNKSMTQLSNWFHGRGRVKSKAGSTQLSTTGRENRGELPGMEEVVGGGEENGQYEEMDREDAVKEEYNLGDYDWTALKREGEDEMVPETSAKRVKTEEEMSEGGEDEEGLLETLKMEPTFEEDANEEQKFDVIGNQEEVAEQGTNSGESVGNLPGYIQMFMSVFEKAPEPGPALLQNLSSSSGLSADHVEKWFRNQRSLQRRE